MYPRIELEIFPPIYLYLYRYELPGRNSQYMKAITPKELHLAIYLLLRDVTPL
jgi:hypothetical protein